MARIMGLDIRDDVVRVVVAQTTGRRAVIVHHSEFARIGPTQGAGDSAPQATFDGEEDGGEATARISSTDALHVPIADMLLDVRPAPDRIHAELQAYSASIRIVEIPEAALKRAEQVLPFELENDLPYDMDEALVDYQIISKEAGVARLLTTTIPKEAVRKALADLDAEGVLARELAPASIALEGLVTLDAAHYETPTLVLDVGAKQTEFCVIRERRCAFARSVAAGISDIADGTLGRELKQTLAQYRRAGGSELEHAVLCGLAAEDPNGIGWFTELLELPFTTLDLAAATEGTPPPPRFGLAAALAARGALRGRRTNLLQGEFAPARTGGFVAKHATTFAACGAALLISFLFASLVSWFDLADERDQLEKQLADATLAAFEEETTSPLKARKLLETGGRQRDPLPKFDAYDTLAAISAAIPEQVTHDTRKLTAELDEDGLGGRFEIRGTVATHTDVENVKQSLAAHECFNDVEIGTTTPASGGKGQNYPIEAKIQCPGIQREKEDKK